MRSIPYVDIASQHSAISDELIQATRKVMEHAQFVLGAEVADFEKRFAEMCGVPYAVGVNSGTDALILGLRALDIGPGDEVITAPNSFISTAGSIALVGARPVFVDVRDDYNIDPELIEKALTPKSRAILPVHLTGRPADMDPIMEVARKHQLYVIEDAAQAVTAQYEDGCVGSIGDIGCFSFHPLKTLNACGDGGAITTQDKKLYEKLVSLRNIGLQTRDRAVFWSGNSRLDTLQAAFLLVKLKHVGKWTEKRRANAKFYQEHLQDVNEIRCPKDKSYEYAVYHTFIIQAQDRDALKEHLAENGIETAIHYPVPIHLQPAASRLGYKKGDFPMAETQAEQILSLPVYPELSKNDLERVVSGIKSFYG